jgi:hypothetical protein
MEQHYTLVYYLKKICLERIGEHRQMRLKYVYELNEVQVGLLADKVSGEWFKGFTERLESLRGALGNNIAELAELVSFHVFSLQGLQYFVKILSLRDPFCLLMHHGKSVN